MIEVTISRKLLLSILRSARASYPRETVLLLRGRSKGEKIEVTDILIPPLATHGRGFAAFPLHLLPIDFTLVGSVHSHPSGVLEPSVGDLNRRFSKVTMIVAYPFQEQNVGVFNDAGKRITLQLTE